MTQDPLALAYQSMIDAAAGEGAFSDTMVKLAEANHAAGAVVFELNRKTGEISNFVSPQLEVGGDGYSEYLNSINPRMRYSLRHAAGHITYEQRFTTEEGMNRSEFYDWLTRVQGLKYFLGVRLFDRGDVSVFHSIEFPDGTEHPDKAQIHQFVQTSRRLANAWRLSKHHPEGHVPLSEGAWTPDYLPWGIIALSDTGRVLQVNAKAQAILKTKDVLTFGSETLEAAHRANREAFHATVQRALAGSTAGIRLRSTATSGFFLVQAIPVRHRDATARHPVAAVLYIWNPAILKHGRPEVLMELWGLSPAEARIALRLARGETLADIADALQITRNTARNQLQSIFEKTDTSRQAELALLLFGVLDVPPT